MIAGAGKEGPSQGVLGKEIEGRAADSCWGGLKEAAVQALKGCFRPLSAVDWSALCETGVWGGHWPCSQWSWFRALLWKYRARFKILSRTETWCSWLGFFLPSMVWVPVVLLSSPPQDRGWLCQWKLHVWFIGVINRYILGWQLFPLQSWLLNSTNYLWIL